MAQVKTKDLLIFGAIAALAVAMFTGYGSPASVAAPSQEAGTCGVQGAVAYTFSQHDIQKLATSVAGSTAYWVNGVAATAESSAPDTVSLSPGDKLDVLSFHPGTHYGKLQKNVVVPCKATGQNDVQLAANGTVSLTVINSNGLTQNADAAAQAIGTDETVTMTLKVKESTSDKYWSNPDLGYYVVSFDYPVSNYTEVSVVGGEQVAVALKNSGTYESSYKIGKSLSEFQEDILTVKLVPKTSVNPTGNVTVAVDDANYYQHTLTNEVLSGIDNNVGADVGSAAVTGSIVVS